MGHAEIKIKIKGARTYRTPRRPETAVTDLPDAVQSVYKKCLPVHFWSGWRRFTSTEVNLTHTNTV